MVQVQPRPLLISVVTICFNAGAALQRTIESVNAQIYPHLEHLIVDGGSSDGSVTLIRQLATRAVRWTSEPDGGIADALNKGTALARGDYVCYLNAGDVFASPTVVALSVGEIAVAAPERPTVFFGDFFSSRDGIRHLNVTSCAPGDFAWRNPLNHQSVFIPAKLARENPYDTRLRLGMDYDLWLRLGLTARFQKLMQPIAVFALDGRSSDPAWAVHNLVVRRTLWHVNRGTRLGLGDIVMLGWKALALKARFFLKRAVGRKAVRSIRRMRPNAVATQPTLEIAE